jgi:hypothetical protein
MVTVLLTAITTKRAQLAEVVGAGLIVYGAAQVTSWAAFVVAGVAVLAKSLEWDLDRGRS